MTLATLIARRSSWLFQMTSLANLPIMTTHLVHLLGLSHYSLISTLNRWMILRVIRKCDNLNLTVAFVCVVYHFEFMKIDLKIYLFSLVLSFFFYTNPIQTTESNLKFLIF